MQRFSSARAATASIALAGLLVVPQGAAQSREPPPRPGVVWD